jgi:putative ABC transport system substrate-binding protein
VKRREFVIGLGGLMSAWPLAARAQQGERVRRIALFFGLEEADEISQSYVATFRRRLQELGWIEGRNIRIDYRWGGADLERIRSQAAELIKLQPEVILSQSGLVLPELQQATRTIPIVFTNVTDPVSTGYVASLARPGGNITGFTPSEFATAGKMLEVLKEIAPAIERATVILNFDQPPQVGMLKAIQAVAQSLNMTTTPAGVRSVTDIERAIDAFAQTPNAGMVVLPNPITESHRAFISARAAQHRLPAVYRYRHFVMSGGLVSYGERPEDAFRSAASYVDRILKGERPRDLPVQQPTKFELVINLKTAKAMNLEISPTMLTRADEVIE